MVDPLYVIVLATISGAVLNTVRGYLNSEKPYDPKKFLGALIVSGFGGLAIAQTIPLIGLDIFGSILIGLMSGFSIDYAVSKAKK